ncbi:uncharacterized protein [Oscarella lobularis]
MNKRCVEGHSGGKMAGTNVEMGRCNGESSQSWFYNKTDYTFRYGADMALCLDAGSSTNCSESPASQYPYCNCSLDAETRAKDLVSRLENVEKTRSMESLKRSNGAGHSNGGVPRLGVPEFLFGECLHGVKTGCGSSPNNASTGCPTSFPHALGLAATFNHTLWSLAGEIVSTEARSLHNQGIAGIAFWAPDVNLFRDPRWGRGQEVPGEDPFLSAEYVAHYSTGLQSIDDSKYLKIISTCKHFSAYDLENWNGTDRHHFDARVTDQDLVDYYWVPFRSCVERARVRSIMCSYNSVNGVPSCANSLFQNDIARGEWGFDGFFVSDCGAVSNIENHHNYTKNSNDTCRVAVLGGCDMNCGRFYSENLNAAVENGSVPEAAITEASYRIYREFIRLGELDPPELVSYKSLGPEVVDTSDARQLAYEAAQQMIVLLKNDGNLLPLDAKKIKTLALIGPHANATQAMLSNYHGTNTLVDSHSPLQALEKILGPDKIKYAQGCKIDANDTSMIKDAVAAAKTSDVVIIFVGLDETQESEGKDRTVLDLPGSQNDLVEAVYAAGKPTVVVLINGGPLAVSWIQDHVPAIVEAFYPGEMGGDAIADVLLGKISPAGRLPVTVYPSDFVNKRSMFDMSLSDNGGITYRYYAGKALWEFGYGLSYTSFSYNWSSLTSDVVNYNIDDVIRSPINYTVVVTNTGSMLGDDVVLAFLTSPPYPGGPLKELFGFQRVRLAPGESTTVHLSVPPLVLASVDGDGVQAIKSGRYGVRVGELESEFNLVGQERVLFNLKTIRERHAAKLS